MSGSWKNSSWKSHGGGSTHDDDTSGGWNQWKKKDSWDSWDTGAFDSRNKSSAAGNESDNTNTWGSNNSWQHKKQKKNLHEENWETPGYEPGFRVKVGSQIDADYKQPWEKTNDSEDESDEDMERLAMRKKWQLGRSWRTFIRR